MGNGEIYMRKYTESHEWVDINDRQVRVGITERALKEIGEVVFIELPKVGSRVREGEEAVILESTKAAVEIASPLTGKVTKVNTQLLENAHLLNRGPEDEGWLFEMETEATENLS